MLAEAGELRHGTARALSPIAWEIRVFSRFIVRPVVEQKWTLVTMCDPLLPQVARLPDLLLPLAPHPHQAILELLEEEVPAYIFRGLLLLEEPHLLGEAANLGLQDADL